jgi:hypothetical protein
MANKIIERLKAGPGPNTRIIRAMNAVTFAFQYDDESGGLFGIDQGGFLMTREELKDLIDGATIFFEHYGDEAVKEHNDEKLNRSGEPHEAEELTTRAPSKGWVYVVKGQDSLYKIGLTTRTPDKRLAEFTPKLPFKTELLLAIFSRDVYRLEKELHQKLDVFRVNGEWFKLTQGQIEWLRGMS